MTTCTLNPTTPAEVERAQHLGAEAWRLDLIREVLDSDDWRRRLTPLTRELLILSIAHAALQTGIVQIPRPVVRRRLTTDRSSLAFAEFMLREVGLLEVVQAGPEMKDAAGRQTTSYRVCWEAFPQRREWAIP